MIELLTVKEAAKVLKTSRQQIWKMIHSELLPAVKVGREWRIPKDYLTEFIDNNMNF